jgi:Yip1 domain
MNLIERVKNILVTPKTEWDVIDGESATPPSLLTSYVIPLALIPAIATFIGWGVIGVSVFGVKISGMNYGVALAVQSFVAAIISFFVCSYIIDALAPTFKSEKNINKSAQLVAYASTAGWVGGIFGILPSLAIIGALIGLYGIYLFYIGMPKLKKTPAEQVVPYMLVSALVIIVVTMVIGFILTKVVYGIVGNPYASSINLNDLFK